MPNFFDLRGTASKMIAATVGTLTVLTAVFFSGAQRVNRVVVNTSTYSIASTDFYVAVSSTSQAPTITLPAASSKPSGSELIIKDRNCTANTRNITVVPTGGDTIDTASSAVISQNCASLMFISNGSSGWEIN